ncbi:hypothetical protein SAMN05660766_0903 [Curtobacterium sp. 314Chir4.1]|uniref:hypothetical protein n=1 Tax=Curtobacterium sp. 314Chir4.1 TaxID=1279028 RepID=UPI000BDA4DDA|nr:hypothetical protein [Curtobacterium sp. 314Chir4.1]SOC87234.1 hypothetical protein SAMN05660766_0903 [Curtobacterium sp. 314Chir4.1]
MAEPVVVIIGGWEHECCGPAVEIGDVVEYGVVSADGARRFEEVRHDTVPNQRIRGRVVELFAIGTDRRVAIDRVPSGRALRGFDDDDDGHLEARWTGQPVTVAWEDDPEFEVVVDPYGKPRRQ